MFLLSLLMSFGMVGMMAPKASSSRAAKSQSAAAKAKAKAKAKALASDTVEKKRETIKYGGPTQECQPQAAESQTRRGQSL